MSSSSVYTTPYALLGLIGIALDTFVYFPFILYWTFSIYKHRNSLIIRKRHYDIIVCIGIIAVFYYLVQRNVGFLIYSDILSKETTKLLQYFNCYFFPFFNYGLLYIMIYRYWLLYFKTMFAAAQSDGEWKMIIDPSEYSKNWWITNKRRFGSGHFLKKYVFLLCVGMVCIEGTIWFFSYYFDPKRVALSLTMQYVALCVDFIIMLSPLIILVYIRQNLPILSDKLMIKDELMNIFIVILLSFIVIFLLFSSFGAITILLNFADDIILKSVYCAISNISTFGTFICIFFQTQWVINKFSNHLQLYASQQNVIKMFDEKMSKKEKKEIKINDVLMHEKAFYVFMNHLIEEHSSECLLAFVEMSQFKEAILADIKSMNAHSAAQNITRQRVPSIDDTEHIDPEIDDFDRQSHSNSRYKHRHHQTVDSHSTATPATPQQDSIEEAQTNIDALQLVLTGGSPDIIKRSKSKPMFQRVRSGSSVATMNVIKFPKSVPKSAIVYDTELNFLSAIPGLSTSPLRERGVTVDDDVISRSATIQHVRSQSNNNKDAIFKSRALSKKSNGASSFSELAFRKKSKQKLERTEAELIEEWKIRAYMLYYKYVVESSEHEINIDYGTRNELNICMSDINEWLKNEDVCLQDLSFLFDACIQQMFQFCNFSMSRFKRSEGFETLIRCFKIEVQKDDTDVPRFVSVPSTPL